MNDYNPSEVVRLFYKKYPALSIAERPLVAMEAIGYIKACTELFPWLEKDFALPLKVCQDTVQNVFSTLPIEMSTDWRQCTALSDCSLTDALEIIDDALCHNFEFRVRNGVLYFREIIEKLTE